MLVPRHGRFQRSAKVGHVTSGLTHQHLGASFIDLRLSIVFDNSEETGGGNKADDDQLVTIDHAQKSQQPLQAVALT